MKVARYEVPGTPATGCAVPVGRLIVPPSPGVILLRSPAVRSEGRRTYNISRIILITAAKTKTSFAFITLIDG
jgi:hypothetical protein